MNTAFLDPLRDLYHEYQMYQTHPGRRQFLRTIRREFSDSGLSIISNNCLSGLLYHDLKKPFLSPIINCRFSPRDFVAFVEDMPYYTSCAFMEAPKKIDSKLENQVPGEDYPCACLEGDEDHPSLSLELVHFDSFEKGQSAFEKRKSRINYDNYVIICEMYNDQYDPSVMERFAALPCRKLMLTHTDFSKAEQTADTWNKDWEDFTFVLHCYEDEVEQPHGKCMLLKDASPYRFYDEVDMIHFLNTGKIRKNADF